MDPRIDQGRWLRIPGPTPLHPEVVKALTGEMVPHRGPVVGEIMERIQPIARRIHGLSDGTVLFFAGTGTSGFEASIVNLFAPGDKVVATVCGDFGHRFASAAETFGLDVRRVTVPAGDAVTPELLDAALAEHAPVKGVLITHNETSTGVTQPLKELAEVAHRYDALVVVDAVSSAAALPIEMDAWGLDWVLSGAQKAWMCPPGLAISALSPRAIDVAHKNTAFPRVFWDVPAMMKAAEAGSHPSTSPITHLYALDAALRVMDEEGIENLYARHARLGRHFRTGLEALGVRVLAKSPYESNSVTAFYAPNGDAPAFRTRVREQSGIEITIGQADLGPTINRVGTMGWCEEPELDATLEALGEAMKSFS